MKQFLFLLYLCFTVQIVYSQQVVVRGRVSDAKTGELLSDVNVTEKNTLTGTATDTYGRYILNLRKGKCIVQYSMLGYKSHTDTLNITENKVINIMLMPDEYQLGGVEIVAHRNYSGQFALDAQKIQSIPQHGGEADPVKSLQFLPGVASGNEGTTNISIRGNNQWGNLVLLDEAIVYNPSHALSFFSVFNNDAINKVNLFKSYFPLKYGGRSSAVIDVSMREGNRNEHNGKATLGVIASKILLEGPIKKGSYLISARMGYPSVPVMLFADKYITSDPEMYFYDFNAKINREIGKNDRLYFSIYSGGDNATFSRLVKGYGMKWGNQTATLRWNHILNDRTNINTSAVFSKYHYSYKSLSNGLRYLWKSNMQSYQLKSEMETLLHNGMTIKGGIQLHHFNTLPGKVEKYGEYSNIIPFSMLRKRMEEASIYAEGKMNLLPKFTLNAGIRMNLLHTPESEHYSSKNYLQVEPRAEVNYQLHKNSRLTLSYTQASQNMHMLSTSTVGIPSDTWLPANELLKPSTMRQVAIGYEIQFNDRQYTLSTELYARKTHHIADYRENANIFMNEYIEKEIETGNSHGYGWELYFSKNQGRLTGWLSYTLSKVRNRINGQSYRPVYDRPHNLKLFLNYALGKHWNFSSTFSYVSGMNLTIPVGKYFSENTVFYIYTDRNGYRAPAFHQLDLSANYRFRKRHSVTLSIINAYHRKNIFSIYAGRDGEQSVSNARIYKMYLYGIIPSISYSFTW
ncbi:MAG: TonB-dependent receptor [Bacteroides sp.]|nr:TonB-dependent receptor [Bacteroides sp.]